MILVDTSIWIDHLGSAIERVNELVLECKIAQHPYVTGEIAVGSLPLRERTIRALRGLPQIAPVSADDFHAFMDETKLFGTGLGFVAIHLLAAAAMARATVWTGDRRMLLQAERLNLSFEP